MNATSKLVKAWESKNAKNAAKAGGISMMALSLAACGGSSTTVTTPVVETPVVDTPVVVTPVVGQSLVMLSSNDVISPNAAEAKAQSSANNDTFYAMTDGLLTSGDVIDGGAGTDTISARVKAADQSIDPTLTSVEAVTVEIEAVNTKDVTIAVGSTDKAVATVTLTAVDTAGDDTEVTLTGVQVGDAVTVDYSAFTGSNTMTSTTVTYDAVTGTTDSAAITLKGAGTDTIVAGIETLSVAVNKFTGTVTAEDATVVTITGGATSTETSTVADIAQSTASLATLNLAGAGETLDVNNSNIDFKGNAVVNITNTGSTLIAIDNLAAATNTLTVTGGAGADDVDIDQVAQGTIVVNTNGGDDKVTIDGGVVSVNTGGGDDTLVVATWSSVTTADAINLDAGAADRVQTAELTLGASQKTAAGYFKGVEIFDITTANKAVTIDIDGLSVVNHVAKSGAMAASYNGTKDKAGVDAITATLGSDDILEISADQVGQSSGKTKTAATAGGIVGGDALDLDPVVDTGSNVATLRLIGDVDLAGGVGEVGSTSKNGGDGGDAVVAENIDTLNLVIVGTQKTTADEVSFTGGAAAKGGAAGDSIVVAANGKIVLTSELDSKTADAAKHNSVDLNTVKGTNVEVDGSALLAKLTVTAGDGNVTLKGGTGDDSLTGGAGVDTLTGGAGKDTLDGNAGVDTFTTGAGADIVKIEAGDAGTTGTEKVTDFTTGATTGDKLDLADTQLLANVTSKDVKSAITSVAASDTLTADVVKGVITLGGNATAKIDTVAELKAVFELLDINNDVEVGAIEMGGNTYVLVDAASGGAGSADSVGDIIMLSDLTGITAVSTTAAADTLFIA